jgi:hypothetical protein
MLHQAETSQGHSVSDCVIGVCGGPGESQRDFFTPSMRFPACSAQYRPERAAEATFTNTIDVDVDSLARCVKLSFETSSVASGSLDARVSTPAPCFPRSFSLTDSIVSISFNNQGIMLNFELSSRNSLKFVRSFVNRTTY